MSKKEKRLLGRILVSAAMFAGAMAVRLVGGVNEYVELAAFLLTYAVIGGDVLIKSAKNISRGQVFDENFLMSVATIGAFCLGEYPEGVAVMLFYQVGELFQSYAVSKSRRSISELMDIRPDYANVLREGEAVKVDPEEVAVGELIIVRPGERVPLDGMVVSGGSTLDTSALTGESAPRDVSAGDEVISGCINLTGVMTVRVKSEYSQSTVAKILELVETATDKKSRSENFITRFARYYTPAVVLAAVVLAIIPPLVASQPFSVWIERALTFLVISCPCALVISVPLSFFGGIGGASKSGVLIKGSNYLEQLAEAKIMVFDKTGTLTKGEFAVSEICPADGFEKSELLMLAAHAEQHSSHPIAVSVRRAYGQEISSGRIGEVEEIAGHGVRAIIDGRTVLAGNLSLMAANGVQVPGPPTDIGTAVHVSADGRYAGYLLIEDEIKPDSLTAVSELRGEGIRRVVMLTGDTDSVGKRVASTLGIGEVYTQLLPADKVARVEEMMGEKRGRETLAFVGDGINDAPVLARADIGIAMGGMGSDAAIEAADIVIMTDEPSKIATAMRISKKTLGIVRQNIVFALAVKAIVMVLGALGYASMWAAVFADVGVSVIAILNAMRALNVPKG